MFSFKNLLSNKAVKYPYQKVSFSQAGEDLIIDHVFRSRDYDKINYIDIGAFDPWNINNTAKFYINGSRGVNIEPDPVSHAKFLTDRKEDQNLNIGIGAKEETLTYYRLSSKFLSSFSKEEVEATLKKRPSVKVLDEIQIQVRTIDNVVKEYLNGVYPSFISIDVEGFEMDILKTVDWENKQQLPIIFCVETISYSQTGKGIKNQEVIDFLVSKGYLAFADTNINTIFVKEDFWIV
jgi:FkbM family methyltransferase